MWNFISPSPQQHFYCKFHCGYFAQASFFFFFFWLCWIFIAVQISNCSKWGATLVAMCRLHIAAASLAAEHGL